MLASDLNNPEFLGAHNPDAVLAVTFYQRAVQNEFLTNKEGRPIYQDCDYVRIERPGDTLTVIDTLARQDHKDRFPVQWARYQNNKSNDQTIGTPLSEWPRLTEAQREQLKALHFRTVEQIAAASDAQIGAVGMIAGTSPMAFRELARSFLNKAADAAAKSAQAAEAQELRDQLAEMQKQLNAVLAENAKKEKAKA